MTTDVGVPGRPADPSAGGAGPRPRHPVVPLSGLPSEQLPTAAGRREADGPLGRARSLRTAWWYTWCGLMLVVVMTTLPPLLAAGAVVASVVMDGAPTAPAVLGAALAAPALAASGLLQAWAISRLLREPPPLRQWPSPRLLGGLLAAAAASLALAVLAAPSWDMAPWLVAPAWTSACLIGCLAPPFWRRGVLIGAGVLVMIAAVGAVTRTPAGLGNGLGGVLFFVVMIPLTVLPTVWLWRVMLRLEEARRGAGDLAVTRERLRFAADLHDVQGHHLQVIALQAELAGRLLDVGRPDEARDALGEVHRIAAQALGETRALVRDLRTVSLADELENAADVLRAAGAAVELHVDEGAGRLAGDAGRTLGLAVREATTNVLRHAAPRRVEIRLEDAACAAVRLVVRNDGVQDADRAGGSAGASGAGTGLAALTERAEALGGDLTARCTGEGFTLEVSVPRSAGAEERGA